MRARRSPDGAAVELIVADAGPGLIDVVASARDGESTTGTLGIGLGAAMRIASWFDSHSVVGRGTVIVATFWRDEVPPGKPGVATITRPMSGETVCGDAVAYRVEGATTTVLLADGLGHGEMAARASQEAVRAFGDVTLSIGPAGILQQLNDAIRATRGAAAAVVQLDGSAETLAFAGAGNVAAWIDDGTQRRSLVSVSGIIGNLSRAIREVTLPLTSDSLVLLHSDGLSSKWNLDAYPGVRRHEPDVIAATLMRDAGVHRDDASIAVARAS